jgi:hypothetical protein
MLDLVLSLHLAVSDVGFVIEADNLPSPFTFQFVSDVGFGACDLG